MLKIPADSNPPSQTQMKSVHSPIVLGKVSWPPCFLFSGLLFCVFFLPHRNFSRVFLCLLLNLALKDYNLLITACFCLAMVQCSNQQSRQEAWAGLDWRKGTSSMYMPPISKVVCLLQSLSFHLQKEWAQEAELLRNKHVQLLYWLHLVYD